MASQLITLTVEILQGLFFVVMGTIGVLTYLRARHTILQPMRTEIFKSQLEELARILRIFVGCGEVALRRFFALEKTLYVNTSLLYDTYASTFFDVELNEPDRPYNTGLCAHSLLTPEFVEKYVEIADGHLMPAGNFEPKDERPDHRVRAARWSQYVHGEIKIPNEHMEAVEKLRSILESQLLPARVANLLEEFLKVVSENVALCSQVLSEAAKEMPERYGNLEQMNRSSFNWITKRYTERFVPLKPKADEIVAAIRDHWDVENVLAPRA